MKDFPVICETCHARLRVRDPQIVGQIHACPKCDSMVHLVPPSGWSSTAADTSADQTPGERHVADSAATQSRSTPPPSAAEPKAPDTEAFAEVASLDLHRAQPEGPPPETLATPDADAPAPQLAGLSARELFWRRFAIWGAAGGIGMFVLGTLAGALWMRSSASDSDKQNLAASTTAADEDREELAADDPTASANEEITADSQSPQQPEQERETANGSDDFTAVEEQDQDAEIATVTEAATPPALPPVKNDGEQSASTAKATSAEQSKTSSANSSRTEDTSEQRNAIDLLSLDPARLELAIGLPTGDAEPAARRAVFEPIESPQRPNAATSEGVSQPLEPVDSEDATELVPAVADQNDVAIPHNALDPVRLGPLDSLAHAPRDVAEQLVMPIDAMEMQQVPLAGWLNLVSRMIAVPITVRPSALERAGIGALEPVDIREENTSAGQLLASVLGPHRLTTRVAGGQLEIVSKGHDRTRKIDYKVADLLDPEDRDATPVAQLVQQVLRPESWQSAGGAGRIDVVERTIRVHQEQGIQLELLVLLERLLLARDLPTKSRYPVERLSIEPTYAHLAAKLDQPTTFTFLAWTPLADVFARWQQELGLSVLVDWIELADVPLYPTSPIACSAQDQPWDQAFASILQPLELDWVAIDTSTIQITSRIAAATNSRLEFYPVADLVRRKFPNSAGLIEYIRDALRRELGSEVGERCRFAFDETSQYLLVLAGAKAQRLITQRLAAL